MSLVARGLTHRIGDATLLRDVDLAVAPGELVALVGPNGAGKSTLLGALAGDYAPTEGEVTLDGTPVTGIKPKALARRRAVMLQQQGLSFGFRVREVVQMGRAAWHGTDRADDDESVVEQSLAHTDTTGLAERRFPSLSGGEQARASFARVLAQETGVLLLDEPTAALDIRHQEQLLGLARAATDAGAAVVVVLHDLSLAGAYADRLCLLDAGEVQADGPPAEVLEAGLLSRVYRHRLDVIAHRDGPIVVPVRTPALQEASCV